MYMYSCWLYPYAIVESIDDIFGSHWASGQVWRTMDGGVLALLRVQNAYIRYYKCHVIEKLLNGLVCPVRSLCTSMTSFCKRLFRI